MTLEEMQQYVASVAWIFAKTMATTPHEYTLRKKAPDREAKFEAVVMFIREAGYRQKFGRTWYKYLDLDGYQYWTMGAAVEKTILINRALLDPAAKDRQAEQADATRTTATPGGSSRGKAAASPASSPTTPAASHRPKCLACGRRFAARRSDAMTCSAKCRVRHHRAKVV
jgi:hypothetical protein